MPAASFPKPTQPPFNLANVPFTDVDPIMDGKATNKDEWAKALRLPDSYFFGGTPRSGFYYFESKLDWVATSTVTGAQTKYEGTTVFVAHDIIGSSDPRNPLHQFQVDDSRDWNSFEFQTPAGTVRIWVFDDRNAPDDRSWLPFAEGLDNSRLIPEGAPPDLIDDRGFIARVNDDPSTDVHWFPGMPEPGDPGWDWAAWHYVFGRRTFGQSFQTTRLDADPKDAVDHQVYEFCSYQPNWKKEKPKKKPKPSKKWPPAPGPAHWCIWWETINVQIPYSENVVVLVDGRPVKATLTGTQTGQVSVLKGQFWLHFWNPVIFLPGDPTVQQQAAFIEECLSEVMRDAPEESKAVLRKSIDSFGEACAALSEGRFAEALGGFSRMGTAIKKARGLGVDPLALIDTEMQVLSLVSTEASKAVMQLDAGTTFRNRNLVNAYMGLYKFGRMVARGREKGLGFEAIRAVRGLKPVFEAAAKGLRGLSRG